MGDYDDLYEEGTETQGGGKLRAKLEETLEVNRKLSEEIRASRVEKALAGMENSLVTEADLTDVPLDKIQERIDEVQAQRVAQEDEILERALARKGLDADSIKAITATDAEEQATSRLSVVAGIGGTSVSNAARDALHGKDALDAHFAKLNK